MRIAMNLDEARRYFMDRAVEIQAECSHRSPWVFLNAAAYIEYLARATIHPLKDPSLADTRKNRKPDGAVYAEFVTTWLGRVRKEYASFTYKDGQQDLPEQMYRVLRCGLVHSFSLIPDEQDGRKDERSRTIVLGHRFDGSQAHLSSYEEGDLDGAVFVAEDLAEDLIVVTGLLFGEAAKDDDLAHLLQDRLDKHPPLTSLPGAPTKR
jgi:hypothetical protein